MKSMQSAQNAQGPSQTPKRVEIMLVAKKLGYKISKRTFAPIEIHVCRLFFLAESFRSFVPQ